MSTIQNDCRRISVSSGVQSTLQGLFGNVWDTSQNRKALIQPMCSGLKILMNVGCEREEVERCGEWFLVKRCVKTCMFELRENH